MIKAGLLHKIIIPNSRYINQLADGRLMHSNSWIEADGWTTDAYMFAVTYDEGTDPAKSTDLFVCYGSALRRGETSYFSSLAKLYYMQSCNDGNLDIRVDGQAYIHADFRVLARPNCLRVNGKDHKLIYDKGYVTLKFNLYK